jgi:hypothetical protein
MDRAARSIAVVISMVLAAPVCQAALFSRSRQPGSNSKISLRKRLHVNTLITEPGMIEVDWSSLYSIPTTNFAMPSAVRYTPEGSHIVWGRTEYSVAFDSTTSIDAGGTRLTQFSQALTFTATSVLHDGEKFDIAVAPQATFFLRDESGARLGAVAIARYDTNRNSFGTTVSWSAATHISPSNPAGILDVGFGFGRQLSGHLEKFTPHVNAEWEKSTAKAKAVLAFEGVEYQLNSRLAFDLSAQHFAGAGNRPDHQLALGLTLNVGHIR